MRAAGGGDGRRACAARLWAEGDRGPAPPAGQPHAPSRGGGGEGREPAAHPQPPGGRVSAVSALSLLSSSCPSPHGTVRKQAGRGAGTRPSTAREPRAEGQAGFQAPRPGFSPAMGFALGTTRPEVLGYPAHPPCPPLPRGTLSFGHPHVGSSARACGHTHTHTHTHTLSECPAGSGPWKEMRRKKEVGSGLTGPTGGEGTGGGSLLPGRHLSPSYRAPVP